MNMDMGQIQQSDLFRRPKIHFRETKIKGKNSLDHLLMKLHCYHLKHNFNNSVIPSREDTDSSSAYNISCHIRLYILTKDFDAETTINPAHI